MFGYLRVFLTVALLAGVAAGFVNWINHTYGTTPLILEAETYENAAPAEPVAEATTHTHEDGSEHVHDAEAWAPEDGWELTAAIVFFGKGADWRRGLLWGLAGFACFTLAPAFGLPPELPGTVAAPLGERQLWWIGTAIATGAGLYAAARLRNIAGYAIAVVLIALPHVVGAPHPEAPGGLAPEELEHKFIVAAVATGLVFWLVLGVLTGALFKRYAKEEGVAA
jgi:predicted cobalt transporter CbtA